MVITRPFHYINDKPYVIDSFLHGFRGEPWAQGCSNDFLTMTMAFLLNRPEWTCTILCDDETPSEILGYVAWRSPQELAWICVKRAVQHNGFAHRLLSEIGTDTGLPINAAFTTLGVQKVSFPFTKCHVRFRPYLAFQ